MSIPAIFESIGVPLKVFGAGAAEGAVQAAFHDSEAGFNRVARDVATVVLFGRVVHGGMLGKLLASLALNLCFIGRQVGRRRDIIFQDETCLIGSLVRYIARVPK